MTVKRTLSVLAAGATASVGAVAVSRAAGATSARGYRGHKRACVRQFNEAVQAYVDATNRHDVRGFTRLLADECTIVLPGGTVFAGKAAGSAFIERFFARTDFTQTFTVKRHMVSDCSTASVLFDSTYTDGDGAVPLVIGLTWTYRHGEWLVVQDQNTVVG